MNSAGCPTRRAATFATGRRPLAADVNQPACIAGGCDPQKKPRVFSGLAEQAPRIKFCQYPFEQKIILLLPINAELFSVNFWTSEMPRW
jgi:hypothetical protein